jgi:hypothetical protein
MTSGRMELGAVQKLLDTDGRSDASLGRPDGNKASDFTKLEFAQNLPGTLK